MSKPRDHCIRCGDCCLSSTPTLHLDDLSLVRGGAIERRYLYTVRKGELVRDNIQGRMVVISEEMIKVKERGSGSEACVFYEEGQRACRIYQNRPIQCSALKCWNTEAFMAVMREPKLCRRDLVEDGVTLGLMEVHEKRCNYGTLEELVKQIPARGDEAIEEILEVLRFDFELRPFFSKKLGLEIDEMDLFFGRSLVETIPMFGLRVVRESGRDFLLTAIR